MIGFLFPGQVLTGLARRIEGAPEVTPAGAPETATAFIEAQ